MKARALNDNGPLKAALFLIWTGGATNHPEADTKDAALAESAANK